MGSTTFINTDAEETIERREELMSMKGIDFMQEAKDYSRVIADLKQILQSDLP